MFQLFEESYHRIEIDLVKQYHYRIKVFNEFEQIGGDIICLKMGYLKNILKNIKENYNVSDIDITFILNQNKENENVG